MSEKNICPGCGRHCDLSEPHCGRGQEYLRTGKMPEQRHGKEHEQKMHKEYEQKMHREHDYKMHEGHEQKMHREHDYKMHEEHEQKMHKEFGHTGHDHKMHKGHDCKMHEGHEQKMHKGFGHAGHDHKMYEAYDQAADLNDRLIINLRDLGRMMRMLYEGKASQKRILMILDESETITQRDLTERLGIKPGSASEILSKLESAGWIVRTQNETDRRTTDVCLTDSGRELAAEALAQRQRRHEEMFSCLSGEEKQELLSLMERVRADWNTRYSERGNMHRHGHHDGHGCCSEYGREEAYGCNDEQTKNI